MRASRLLQQQLCFSSCYPRSSYDFGKKKSCSLRGRRFVILKSFPLVFQRGPMQTVRPELIDAPSKSRDIPKTLTKSSPSEVCRPS